MLLSFFLACGAPQDTACDVSPSWDGWAEGFFLTWCSSCHSETTTQRHGAPEFVILDTEEQILPWKERIEIRVIQQQTMPVGGGISAEELDRLQQYLTMLEMCQEQ